MTQISEPDPDYIRTREAYHHLVYTFSTSLPPLRAASMMRQSQAALRTLLRAQAVREKRDANALTAAWIGHMAPAALTDSLTASKGEPAQPEPELDAPDVALYETIYPERAALIRRHGGVPADVTFGPPDEDTVRAFIATRSPTLKMLLRQAALDGISDTIPEIDTLRQRWDCPIKAPRPRHQASRHVSWLRR
jgi:hypothetical protein